jgi:hypothetical protein
MTRKLTEEEYLIIVDCFDRLKDEYYFGLMNHNIVQKNAL